MAYPFRQYQAFPRVHPIEKILSVYSLRFVRADSDYLQVPHHVSLNTPNGLTIKFWIRTDDVINDQPIFDKWDTSFRPFECYHPGWGLGRIYIGVYFTDGTSCADFIPTSLGEVSRVACTYDPALLTNNYKLFKNGVLVKQVTNVGKIIRTTLVPLTMGSNSALTSFFDGLLDEFSLSGSPETPTQIMQDYLLGVARSDVDCRLCLRFEEGAGVTVRDISGYGNNGAITGADWRINEAYEFLVESGLI